MPTTAVGVGQVVPVSTSASSAIARPVPGAARQTLAAWGMLALADAILTLRGFPGLHRLVSGWSRRRSEGVDAEVVIADANAAFLRARVWYFKRALCLQRAAAMVCYLRSRGIDAKLAVGVRKIPFAAHAWAELDGVPLDERPAVVATYRVIARC